MSPKPSCSASAIVGAAFLLSWAAEVAQLDISAGLAIAVLAFIAVLPEYAVDLVFAIEGRQRLRSEFGPVCHAGRAAGDESPCSLALANMTGANRLLIGVGWSMVVFIAWWQWRRRGPRGCHEASRSSASHSRRARLPRHRHRLLADPPASSARSRWSTPPSSSRIFVAYTIRISRAPAEEPHLVGPARWIGAFSVPRPTGDGASACSSPPPA